MTKLIIFLFLFLTSCVKYQVVSEVRVNMYHLHHPKKGAEIIITRDSLEIGKLYRLNQVKVIDPDSWYGTGNYK
tara:strand:- start:295 stop:516 length:222 start_codon:yes stop_codon:yes gene_type:complete